MHFYVFTLAWAPLGAICMHFYVVYTRLGSPGGHLYAFLRGVHSPGLPWGAFVCIFTWCTLAWARLRLTSNVQSRLSSCANGFVLNMCLVLAARCFLMLGINVTVDTRAYSWAIQLFNRARGLVPTDLLYSPSQLASQLDRIDHALFVMF